MNSTPDPKETEPHDALTARADERLAHAHEEIKRADEQLTRLSEQLAKMERDDARPPSAVPAPREPARPDLARKTWSQGLAARTRPAITARKAGAPDPRRLAAGGVHHCRCPGFAVVLWRRAQADCRPLGAAARFNAIIAAGKSAVSRAARSIYRSSGRGGVRTAQATPPQPTTLAQAAPQDAAPAAAAAPPDQTQLLQTIARDLANLERNIEQLKANQQQIASDNSKAIGELKASQEEMKRALAKVSEQSPPKASQSPPPAPPAPAVRRPERTVQPPQARARPRYPKGVDLRRLVAVDAVIDRAYGTLQRSRLDLIVTPLRGDCNAPPSPHFRISPLSPHPTCQFREAGAACSHG